MDLVRSRLADGTGHDRVLALLRQHGAHKVASMRIMADATGMGLGKAKVLVHLSPVWDDRRASDEAFHEWLFRGMFVLAVLGEAEINAPAEDVAECEERRQRAEPQLRDVAAGLPEDALPRFHELMAEGLLGRAFAELVAVVREQGAQCWAELAAVADTLLLTDEEEPAGESEGREDWAFAAFEVHRRARYPSSLQNGDTGPTPPPSG
ncbi:hypothetical protein OG205_30125 [Lentzea sp. NBC_00516]|uniref:hypothetical protein n=1 Tax=Lentzea sp. NBC_00516 TaxID=2903582 RepID=UPI002E807D30|nr:hypothetical protein [Lentzea sp. NBC_00516]WUD22336.1 hypothetical protein OG205_30125 [Lentzea sp. NBC_00516]